MPKKKRPNYETMNYAARREALDLGPSRRKAQLERIFIRDHGICQLCREECIRTEASREHIKGLDRTIEAEEFSNDENVVLAHKLCNNLKGRTLSNKIRTIDTSNGHKHLHTTIADAFPDFSWQKWIDGFTNESA